MFFIKVIEIKYIKTVSGIGLYILFLTYSALFNRKKKTFLLVFHLPLIKRVFHVKNIANICSEFWSYQL